MAQEFKLPEIGEGVVEGEIVEWHVAVGDEVQPDQPVVAMLTDKATVEITADFHGRIAKLHGEVNDLVEVGSVLISYEAEGSESKAEETPEKKEKEAPKNAGQADSDQEAADGEEVEFPLPEIGEGVMEGEIVEWHVGEGDPVSHDQPIASVLTDKATVEITSPYDGKVVAIHHGSGDIVQVGDKLMTIAVEGGSGDAKPAASKSTSAPAEKADKPAREKKTDSAAASSAASQVSEVDPKDNPSISAFGTPLATPAVRRFASQKGVDLTRVKGSGPNHRITREDVERALSGAKSVSSEEKAASSAPKVQAADLQLSGEERREKIRGLRKAIYNSMTRSKTIVPHFTYVDEVEMDKLIELRSGLKGAAEKEGIKLTYLPFIAKAIVLALKKFPIMNAVVDDEAGEIVYKPDYNIGIATATKAGLTVPVCKNVDRKTILEVASEVAELSDRARNQRSTMDDISGGTFTITSLGRLGGLFATPIINHPEVGILGIHNLQERAVVRNGQIVIRQMMNISLSFDHRVVDGDVGATFAQEVKGYLEEPGKLLLGMV